MNDPRQHVHQLIDMLPPDKLAAVKGLLEVMVDPLDKILAAAEIEDEPISEEERRAVAESHEWLKHNHGISL